MVKRSLFYWARMFAEQNKPEGENYNLLKKAISIIIMDYCLEELEGQDCHSIYDLYEHSAKAKLTEALEQHYVELPKFKSENQNSCDIWLEFITNPLSCRVKEEMKTNQPLDMAYEEIQRMSLSEQEREVYFAREKALADIKSLNAQAREYGFAQGLEEGREEGEEKGREKEQIKTVVKALKKGRTKEFILEEYEYTEEIYQRGLSVFQGES